MKKDLKNIAASIRQRLTNHAQKTHRPFDELLQYYSMERFLYRLSQSEYRDKVVLKGALMFIVWETPRSRATKDIDLLGYMQNTIESMTMMVLKVCQVEVEPDGMAFDPKSVKGARIKEDADYEGVRVHFTGRLGQARALMQIDFGFGDTVSPDPILVDYPTIFDMPQPKLKGYPRETVVAEKFEAMVDLGILNSRMKDFYDLWLLAEQFDFNGNELTKAIKETFVNRRTDLQLNPLALSDDFANNPEKSAQWTAFVRKSRLDFVPKDLNKIQKVLRVFLLPIVQAIIAKKPFNLTWKAPGPWKST